MKKRALTVILSVIMLYLAVIGYVINHNGLRNDVDVWLELANPTTLMDVYLNA